MAIPSFARVVGRTSWLVLLCAGALGGCDDGGGGIESGVDGSKELSELSSSEADKLCDAAEKYSESALSERVYMRYACVTLAMSEADVEQCRMTQATCEQGRLDGGLELPDALFGLQRQQAQCLSESTLASCDATVAELESCYEALIGQRLRELYQPRCESLATGEEPGRPGIEPPSVLPVCQRLQQECPGLPPLLTDAPIVIEPPDPIPGFDAGPPDPPDPPDPVDPTCAELSMTFDGTDCASEGCSGQVECDCDPFTQSFSTCNQVLGCLSSVDCEAACQLGLGSVYSCAGELDCTSDADCGSYYCVDESFGGECSRGEPGDSCVDSGDCASGSCATVSGLARCAGTAPVGDPCSEDSECASGICYFDFSVSSVDGTCSSGDPGEPCSSDDECVDGTCVSTEDGSVCSEGGDGDPCDSDFECDSGICAYGGTSYQTCGDAAFGAPCDSSGDCTSGNCETSSTTGESSCGYAIGDECDDGAGVIDCDLECRPSQGDCGSSLCAPECGGGSCSGETLAAWSDTDLSGSLAVSGSDDLTASTSGLGDEVRATLGQDGGTYYFEVTVDTLSVYDLGGVGVAALSATLDGAGLATASVPGVLFGPSGTIANSAGDTLTGCGYVAGDVIGVALDLDDELVYFSVNGVWQAGASPDDAEGGIDLDFDPATDAAHPALELWSGDIYTANFGQATFAYPPPAGYGPLY